MLKLAGILILAIVLTSLFSPIVIVAANDTAPTATLPDVVKCAVVPAW